MRRSSVITALAACLAGGSLASAAPGNPPGPDAAFRLAWVKVSYCSRVDHSAAFYGRMNRLFDTDRMSMRFTLLERGVDDQYAPVRAPGLGRWRKSKSGVRAFGYRQRVRGLVDGSFYRTQVDFRWYDSDGELVHRARRRSRTCNQAGPLPNLRVQILDSVPTQIQGVTRYRVGVANRGRAPADGVSVRFAVDGSAVDTQTVEHLEPDEAAFLSFRGPDCKTGVEATADPDRLIRETAEDDNVHALSCAELPTG
jgi:CARDB